MARTPTTKSRNKSSRHRAKLKAKHTKQRMRARGELKKRMGGRRLRR